MTVPIAAPRRWPRWVRYAVSGLAALAVLAAVGVISYRVLTPADTLVGASTPYPPRPSLTPARYGELISAPLIVDGRLRIFAEARRVWADAELTARREVTPYWSYRRWPAEVAGVVAVEGRYEGAAVVIVKFSDGMVVALDARTGSVAWQDQNRPSERDRYEGRRTGAQTVYQPDGLFTARSGVDGSPVLIAAGADQVRAYNPWNGERKWEHTFTENPGCHDVDWTGETTYVAKDSCAAPARLDIFDAASGRPLGQWRAPGVSAAPAEDANWYAEPVSCVRGHSGCGLIRAAAVSVVDVQSESGLNRGVKGVPGRLWRLNHDGTVVEEVHATSERTFLLGELLVQQEVADSGHIKVILRTTGVEVGRSRDPLQLLAANQFGVYALTDDFHMVLLHPTTLIEQSRVDLRRRSNENWHVGFVDVVGHMVVVERTTGGSPSESDDRYYLGPSPVVIASV